MCMVCEKKKQKKYFYHIAPPGVTSVKYNSRTANKYIGMMA